LGIIEGQGHAAQMSSRVPQCYRLGYEALFVRKDQSRWKKGRGQSDQVFCQGNT